MKKNLLKVGLISTLFFTTTAAIAGTVITWSCTGAGAGMVCTYCVNDKCTTCSGGSCKEK